MSCTVKKTTITLTKGDTLILSLNLKDTDGEDFIPDDGDEILFGVKRNINDPTTAFEKAVEDGFIMVPATTTKTLEPGVYLYDLQLTTAQGVVTTIINRGRLIITEEVF